MKRRRAMKAAKGTKDHEGAATLRPAVAVRIGNSWASAMAFLWTN
jgi:hypothetical protein